VDDIDRGIESLCLVGCPLKCMPAGG